MVSINNRQYTISVIVSCYNEEGLIEKTLDGIPNFVDNIIVIDDASADNSLMVINKYRKKKLIIIKHQKNTGVGSTIIDGYKKALEINSDIIITIDGDNQMDPKDMLAVIKPISEGFDYVKGNRLNYKEVYKIMPKIRFAGNWLLTILTKLSSGYFHLMDSQCGYTAIKADTLRKLDFKKCYKKYGFLNDLLINLNIINAKVKNVPIRPIYEDEISSIKYFKYIKDISYILLKGLLVRIWKKHIIKQREL